MSADSPLWRSQRTEVTTATGRQQLAAALNQRVIYVDTIADLQALPTSGLVDGQRGDTKEARFYWDASAGQWSLLELKTLSGGYSDYLEGLSSYEGPVLFRKVSASRFEIFTPFVSPGRFCRWRFDNDEGQFSGAVSPDSTQGYVRPFLQTTVTDVFFESSADISIDSATASSAPVDIGNYKYVSGIGEYFEFTGVRATRLRCTVLKTTNACIMKVTINGSASFVNLIEKDGSGDAIIDLYDAAGAGESIMLAENLPDTDLTVRFEVVDKNPSSTDYRLYMSDLADPKALRAYSPYTGLGTPIETVGETLKIGGSAVDYAISFRPSILPNAGTPFIGSVHGFENRNVLEIYIDRNSVDITSIPDGEVFVASKSVTLHQSSDIYHPDQLSPSIASASITWDFSHEGAKQSTSWVWDDDVYVANGYTQMWTVYGANQGGAGGPLMGWADKVVFRGFETYPLVTGDSAEYGHHLSDEVLFFGTPYSGAEPNRNADSGLTACLVKMPDLHRSFADFSNTQALADGVWVQDRAAFRKLYLQTYRAAGEIASGDGFNGSMTVSFYKSPRMENKISVNI